MAKNKNNSSGNAEIMSCLNDIFESEMGGITRYLHYSFMVMGHNRIPIQGWLRGQANESMAHAVEIGEKITSLGGHPPMVSASVKESNIHSVDQILKESLQFEEEGLALYSQLVQLASNSGDIALEELARGMVKAETEHCDEVKKMIRQK
jgi:bacterioferritin